VANAKNAKASDVDLWVPLFIGDYLSDTMHLTTEEHGAYLLLMMAYWKNKGPLADKRNSLCAITRLSGDAWSNAQAVLEEFFSIENGVWKHGRIAKALEKARSLKDKKVTKAKNAAAARWKDHKKCSTDAQGDPQALLEDMHDECPSPSPSPLLKASPAGGDAFNNLPAPPNEINIDFPMTLNWEPGDDFDEKCRASGIDLKRASQGRVAVMLGEFKNYWMTRPGRLQRQNQWEHTLLKQVIRLHGTGGLYEDNNGSNQGPDEIDWSDISWIENLPEGDSPSSQ